MYNVISLLFVKHELHVGNKAIIIMVQDYDCHNFVIIQLNTHTLSIYGFLFRLYI